MKKDVKKQNNLEKLNVQELMPILIKWISVSKHHKISNHVIHAILRFVGSLQYMTLETQKTQISKSI